jgi:hypothetical protein
MLWEILEDAYENENDNQVHQGYCKGGTRSKFAASALYYGKGGRVRDVLRRIFSQGSRSVKTKVASNHMRRLHKNAPTNDFGGMVERLGCRRMARVVGGSSGDAADE